MTNNAASSGIYSFNDIQVDTDGLKVTRAGLEIALEPKAHSLLRVLLSRPGHAFTHQELLDAVWGHRHVTPGVLVRLVGILRRALGDEDSHERYIQTIHGVGYRFNLPTQQDSTDIELPIDLAANDPTQPLDIVTGRPEPESADTIGNDTLANATHIPATRYNRQFLQLAVLLFVLLSLWALLYVRRTSETSQETKSVDSFPVLAVMPFRALDKDERSSPLAASISENITGLLSRTPGIRITAPVSSSRLANVDIATQLNASHFLEGTVQHEQQRVFMSMRLMTTGTRRTVWSQSFERQSDPGFLLQRQIARTASKELVKAMQLTVIPAGENPQLYKRYFWARQSVIDANRANNVEFQDAERELRQLTIQHPKYARAWSGLATIYMIAASSVDKDRPKNRELAIAAAKKALSLDKNQAEATAALGGLACRDQNWDKCLSLSQRAVDFAPSDAHILAQHAQRLITVGYVKQGLKAIDDSLAIDPLSNLAGFSRGRALDTLGLHQEARDQLLSNDRPGANATALYMNAMWRNDFTDAKRIASELPMDSRWRDSEITLATSMTDASQWPELMRKIEKSEAEFESSNRIRPYSLERLFLPKRDYALDIDGLNTMQVLGYTSYQWILWQPQSRELRASDAFRQYIEHTGLKAFWKKNKQPDFCTIDKVKEANCE